MAKQGNIRFGVGFDVDKSGLEQLKSSIASLSHIDKFDLIDANADIKELNEVKRVAGEVGNALQKSFNQDLGTYNIQTFKKTLSEAGLTTQSIGKTFAQAGEKGKIAFRNMVSAISSTKLELKETHNILDKMGETLTNTIRWSIASTAINSVTGSIQKAWGFTKSLDSSLNDIMIVTGKNAEEMDKFAVKANNAAKSLGANTKAYTDAALIYYQQGLGDTEAQARADVTVKAANVTGQSAQAVSEQLTAVWNGYKVSAEESEAYIDKLAAVAASTAADLEELSTGMSRVAAAANIMGVDIDQLNAQLATIVSVTREAPESIGTALKTVYARMSDIEAGIDSETTLGEYTAQMAEMGINVLDAKGNLRDMGDVVEEIGEKWSSLNREQQVALAQSIAGTRQYSRMMALFDNWDQYQEALTTSQTSVGALQKQQNIYMESLEGHLNQLTASSEKLYSKLFDSDSFKSFIDILAGGIDVIANIVESLGGGGGVLFALIPLLTKFLSKTLSQSIAATAVNFINARDNAMSLKNALSTVKTAINEIDASNMDNISSQFLQMKKQLIELRQQGIITDQQFEEMSKEYEGIIDLANQASELKGERERIDAQMDSGENIGEKVRIADISAAAAEGDKNKTQKVLDQYISHLGDRQSMFTEATGSVEMNVAAEGVSYEDKIASIQAYMEAYKQAAEASGLLSEEQLHALDQEIAKINEATEAGQKKRDAQLQALQEEEASLNYEIQSYYSDGEEVTEQEQAAIAAKMEKIKVIREEMAAIQNLNKLYKDQGATVERLAKKAKKSASQTADAVADGAKQAEKTAKKAATGIEKELDRKTKQAAKKAQANLQKINLTSLIKGFINVTSAVGQTIAAINTFSNLDDIWDNKDLSTGEKMAQTLSNVSMALMMLLPTIGFVIKGIKGLTTAAAAHNAIQDLQKGKALSLAGAQTLLTFCQDKLTDEQKESIKTTLAQAAAQGASTVETKEGAMADLVKISMEKLKARSFKETTKAILNQTKALMTNPYTLIIIAVIALIMALISAIAILVNWESSEAKAAREAAEASDKLNEAFTKTKEAYDKLQSSISKYKDAKKGIEELTEGTTEWRNAIQDANTQALELLKTYPELTKYMTRDANGLITISDEGLDILSKQEYQKVLKAQNASLIGEQAKRSTNIALLTKQAQEETDSALAWEASAEQITKISNLDEYILSNEEAFKEAIQDSTINIDDEDLVETMWENRDSILELKAAIEENNRLLAIENAQIYTNRAAEMGVNELDAGAVGGMVAAQQDSETFNAEVSTIKEEILELNGDNEEYIEEWAAAMGIAIEEGSIGGLAGDYFEYTDAEGNEHEVSYEVMAEQLAANRVHMKNTAAEVVAQQVALLDRVSADLSSSGNEAIRKIFASNVAITKDNLQSYNKETIAELQQILDTQQDSLSEIQRQAIENSIQNLEDYLNNMGEKRGWFTNDSISVQGAIAQILGEEDWNAVVAERTSDTLEKFGDALQKFAAKAGAEGLSQAKDFFANIEHAEELILGLDWESQTLSTDFVNKMLELGESLDYTDETTFDMVLTLSRLNGTFLATKETWNQVSGIISNLKAHGDTLSQEDFATLYKQYGEAAAQYFTKMEDGTYALAGAAQAFYDIIHEAESKTVLDQLETAIEEYGNFGELQTSLLTATVTTEQKTGSQEQAMADAAVAAWDNVTSVFDIGRKRMSIQTLTKHSGYTEKEAQAILQAYFESGEDGRALREQVAEQFGYTQNADGSYNYSEWDWDDITEESGGDTLVVDVDGIDERVDYSTMSAAIIASGKSQAGIATKGTYHSAAGISNLIDQALTNGLLDSDKAEQLREMLKDDNNLRVSGSTSSALTAFKEAIKTSNTDTSNIKEFASQYLKLAENSTDLAERTKQLEDQFGIGSLLGQEWNTIIGDAETSVSLKENQKAAETYQKSISNLTASISILEGELSALEQVQDILYGQDVLDNLTKQNEKINEQISLLKKKKELNAQEARRQLSSNETDPSKMTDVEYALKTFYASENNTTLEAVASTNISTILQGLIGKTTIENEEDYQALLLAMQTKTVSATNQTDKNKMTESVETIIESLGEVFNEEDGIAELLAEGLEKNLEKFQYSLQLNIDTIEAKKSYNEFLKNIADESDFESLNNIFISGFELAQDTISTYYDTLASLSSMEIIDDEEFKELKEVSENMISASAYQEQRQEILNSLIEEGVNLKETLASIDENIIASQEAVNEAYDKYVEYIESANSALEHQASLYELMYGDRAFTKMQNYYAQMSNSASLIANARASQYTADLAEYEAMLANRDQYSKEQIESITSQYMSSADMYMQALNDRAAAYQEQYLNTVQVLLDEFDQTISQGKGTEKLKEEWDWIHSTSEDYLNNMEASFALSSLEASFTKAIDNSASINAQKKLNDLREQELKKLREKDKLTQYDIDRANKRLEIAQAEIALQEAQANKSKMRLTRGADGTYSYQYVADQDAIAEKTEQLNKLQQDLVSLDEDKLKSSLDTAYDLYSEWMSKVQELVESGATEEEILEMTTKYTERIAGLGQEVQSIFGNLEASFEGANTLLDTNFDISETLPWLDSGWMAAFKEATYQGFDTLFEGTLERILTAKDDYDNKIEEIDSQLNDESGVIAQYLKFFEGEDGLLAIQQREIDAAEEVASNLMNLVPVLEEFRTVMQDLNAGIAAESFLDPYLADNVSERGGAGSLQWIKFKDTEGMKELAGRLVEQFGDELNTDTYRHMLADMNDNDSMYVYNYERLKEFLKAHNLESLATGGYTGEWDDSGRLAVLHQKELVLNQDDTRNILAAVDLIRNLETALSASMYDKILSEAHSMFTRELFDLGQVSDIEQNVYINAEFPNAEDKDEIREAFQEIIALAQQRVLENNRK